MKKAIKKIVALGMGASMLGATLLGAAAADLNDFPSPFVSGGKFTGTLVVGDNAAAEDVVGISDIAMSLQFSASVKAGTGASSTTTVEGDAWRVAESGDSLNLFQNLSTVTNVLDEQDLSALSEGQFRAKNNADYTQELTVPTVSVQWTTDSDAEVEDPDLFLVFPTSRTAIDFELDFTTPAESDIDGTNLDDFEDEKISFLGREYTITKAINTSSGDSTELTLMSGAVQTTQEVGETKVYSINGKDYEVTVMVVSGEQSNSAITKLIVNDEVTKSLSKDDTYTLQDGTEIGIKEVLPTKAGDVQQNLVEFFIGAEKVLIDGKNSNLEISEETINDVTVTLTDEDVAGEKRLEKIEVSWTPTDDYFVPVGGKLSDVVDDDDDYIAFLEAFGIDYQFAGLEASNTETVRFYPSGDEKYKVQFTNRDNVEYDEKLFYYNSTVQGDSTNGNVVSLGQDASRPLHINEGEVACDNHMFIVEFNKHSRILELTDVSTGDQTISLKDKGTGKTTEHSYSLSGASNISSPSFDGATYTLNVTDVSNKCLVLTNIAADNGDTRSDLWTKYDTKIQLSSGTDGNLTASGDGANIVVTEDEDGKDDATTDIDTFSFNFSYSSGDSDIRLDTVGFSDMSTSDGNGVMIDLDSDDNANRGMTQWGNLLEQTSTDDQDKWVITIREDEAVAEVYITAGVTSVSRSDSVTGDAVILQRIDVGATKLASEVAGLETSSNLLLVGGPCANPAVEAASDEFPTCSGWSLDPGEALIQLVEQSDGSVALLIAGTTAADTRAATKLVAEQDALQALPDGVMAQVLTTSTGVLVDFEAPIFEDGFESGDTSAWEGTEE